MQYAVIDLELATELFPNEVEFMRKSNDGTQVVVHKEILDAARPADSMNAMMLPEGAEDIEQPYPFPLYSGDEINSLPDFSAPKETLEEVPQEEAQKEAPAAPTPTKASAKKK